MKFKVEERIWEGRLDYMGRTGRRAYEVHIPPSVADSDWGKAENRLRDDLAPAVSALKEAGGRAMTITVNERLLLRSEAVNSSRIEGIRTNARNLSIALAGGRAKEGARLTAHNLSALARVLDESHPGETVGGDWILGIHRTIMAEESFAGLLREEQNWIGGSDLSPVGAVYVPPPPEHVPGLLGDLVAFVNRGDVHPIVQIGVAHAQFESIHPFLDGNGRTGRALTQALLRRQGLPCVPLSAGLMAARDEYYRSLDSYRLGGAEASIRIHARALRAAAAALSEATDRSSALIEAWSHRLRGHSPGADREVLLPWLLGNPAFTTPQFESATQMPERSRRRLFGALTDAGVVRRVGFTVGPPPSVAVWEVPEAFGVLDDLESRTVALMQSG